MFSPISSHNGSSHSNTIESINQVIWVSLPPKVWVFRQRSSMQSAAALRLLVSVAHLHVCIMGQQETTTTTTSTSVMTTTKTMIEASPPKVKVYILELPCQMYCDHCSNETLKCFVLSCVLPNIFDTRFWSSPFLLEAMDSLCGIGNPKQHSI